jgi:hypothetical protein
VDIQAVRVEIATLLGTITGLRAYEYAKGAVNPPAALVGYPERLSYVNTYARGQTVAADLPVLLLVGRASDRAAAIALGAYCAETGAKSIPAKLEGRAGLWTSCDVVTCAEASFPDVSVAGVDLLAAEFRLQIIGKGV